MAPRKRKRANKQRQQEWKRVRAEAESTLERTAPIAEEFAALKAFDAELIGAIDKAGPQHWRELCRWFLEHPKQPLPPEVARAALRWVVELVPDKAPSGEIVAELVELFRASGMGSTEAQRFVAARLGPMKSADAVRKDDERHRKRHRKR